MSGNFVQDNTTPNQENVEFNALLEKSQQSMLESKLQVARVGGYTKKSVEDFIAEMRQSVVQVKAQLERQILDLAAEKASATQECTVLRAQLKTAVDTLAARKTEKRQDGTEPSAAEQELIQARAENERLKSKLLEQQANAGDQKMYEELLKQKESELAQLSQTLAGYKDECGTLREKIDEMVSASFAADEEISALRQQKDNVETKYQKMLLQMEKANLELAEKKQDISDAEIRLEQKKQQLDELQSQLDQAKLYLEETRAQLELKDQQLAEIQARLESELQAREYWHMVTNELDEGRRTPEDWQEGISGEKLIESLYMQFSQLRDTVDYQKSIISEKESLLAQFKDLENETAALRQENENAKSVIASLKSSFEEVMEEMDEQSETLNRYISRSRKDRELLKTALNSRHKPLPDNPEQAAQQGSLPEDLEAADEDPPSEENAMPPISQILRFDNARKIIPLSDNDKGPAAEKPDEGKYNPLTKAADI
ncbi:hypothetical protein SAMN02745823_03186 [Sporobacter termitidis DSM 10068]|uniref:Uncharacterized protein n=1 Tax=Sporobacter termitidis DSM 10068 TaxID=1123282 RepID=A0A1M5Z475_9FIRM|nr:hypothetical protein [Sporobacter termitidis]SHI18934.1 hypothetical protein SAMN02745823_03186 [Sporobacter termitidis DSM 10068]